MIFARAGASFATVGADPARVGTTFAEAAATAARVNRGPAGPVRRGAGVRESFYNAVRSFPRPVTDLTRLQLLCFDVDGVMTDGGLIYDDAGYETKRFDARDGLAIKAWMRLGGEVAIVTGRGGGAVQRRARELGIQTLVEQTHDKLTDVEGLANARGLEADQVLFMGDDLADLEVMDWVGVAVAPPDAAPEIRALASFVTEARGGHGAVREAIEQVIRGQGRWDEVLAHFRPRANAARGNA